MFLSLTLTEKKRFSIKLVSQLEYMTQKVHHIRLYPVLFLLICPDACKKIDSQSSTTKAVKSATLWRTEKTTRQCHSNTALWNLKSSRTSLLYHLLDYQLLLLASGFQNVNATSFLLAFNFPGNATKNDCINDCLVILHRFYTGCPHRGNLLRLSRLGTGTKSTTATASFNVDNISRFIFI